MPAPPTGDELVGLLRQPLDALPDPLPVPSLAEVIGIDPLAPKASRAVGDAVKRGAKRLHAAGSPNAFDGGLRIVPPGSKSLTNRALLLAALAEGDSVIRRPLLDADDARRMLDALRALGVDWRYDAAGDAVVVRGLGGTLHAPPTGEPLFLNNAGTATRFLAAAAVLADGPIVIDGNARMRERPLGELIALLRHLGAEVEELGRPGFVPIRVHPLIGDGARELAVPTTQSSQFISALLMVAPCLKDGLTLRLVGDVTSRSYIDMTIGLMNETTGAATAVRECSEDDNQTRGEITAATASLTLTVGPDEHSSFMYDVEPDASGATYFWGAAALLPGVTVRVPGLMFTSLQADARFLFPLRQMGASIAYEAGAADCTGPADGQLRGIGMDAVSGHETEGAGVDFSQTPDAAMTLAAVAAFANSPTRLTGVRTLRVKETDRLHATATELRRVGVAVDADDDSVTIRPANEAPHNRGAPVVFKTYDDHRMAMALSLVCLRTRGCAIAEPACVAKTYPTYFADLATLYEAAVLAAVDRD